MKVEITELLCRAEAEGFLSSGTHRRASTLVSHDVAILPVIEYCKIKGKTSELVNSILGISLVKVSS